MIGTYLTQTVTIHRRTGSDVDGQATYASAVSALARVQQRKRLIRNEAGEQVVSDMQVFLGPATAISEGDRITYTGASYHVLSVTEEFALDVLSHRVAWTGRAG